MHYNTKLDSELISAYNSTIFHVNTAPSFILKVDIKSNELNSLLIIKDKESAAFITAFNPLSVSLSDTENQSRNLMLKSDLERLQLEYIDGFGQDPEGTWDSEASFLVLGIDLDVASNLGNKYQQNAILWSDHTAIPRLILLR